MREILQQIYAYRALVGALVQRHLSARYRGSILGFLWSFLNPLFLMLVYTVVFHYYMRATTVPNYTIFLFVGLLPWIWMSSALSEGTSSISSGGHLITKSLFPAHILPLVAVLTSAINFLLSLPLLAFFLIASGMNISPWIVLLPIIGTLQGIFLYGVTLILGSLNVLFRDVQHLIANILSFLFFLCPIVYPSSTVPAAWRWTLDLNPFAGFTMCYQHILFEGIAPQFWMLGYLSVWAALMLVAGSMVYRRYHESFAELL